MEMEISTDGYLHKKFKKQLNTDPMQIIAKEQSIVKCVPTTPYNLNNDTSLVVSASHNDVPKFSTNNENIFLAKSSISHIGNSIVGDGIGGLNNSQSFNNCISYVISSSDRVEDINQRDTQHRPVNFDRKFNILESITIPKVETSSILDNVYSKPYITSKLVSVENVGGLPLSTNLIVSHNDTGSNTFDDSLDRNGDNQIADGGVLAEKSAGGKYICSYCNLACSKPSVLQKHIRAHTNERPYPCVSCGFSFKTRSNLYKHCRSRTHANRVMGNKAQEIQTEGDSDSHQSRPEYTDNITDDINEESAPPRLLDVLTIAENRQSQNEKSYQDLKTKPYKPRFHTAKTFFEETSDNQRIEDQRVPETVQNKSSSSNLLTIHINDVINKNNAIVNSGESYLIKKRAMETASIINEVSNRSYESYITQHFSPRYDDRRYEEPLNLTNKIRKRCISEVTEPTLHTSLIKELLLKNLYADPNTQCPHCKMIFQTVTELELHKMRNCKAFSKIGAKYSRSSSVNVASILTKNKNAFDSIPHLPNTVFPLKSPGPCLGKTRLVENDKSKIFSFDDDSLPVFQTDYPAPELLKSTLHSSVLPVTMQLEKVKKTPVKLFGGEVKITQTSGESKSFKIDNKEANHYNDYNNKLSENRVVKSSLHSGGTVLQNTQGYDSKKQDSLSPSPNIFRAYENSTLSPSVDLINLEKPQFNFDRQHNGELSELSRTPTKTSNETSTNFSSTNSIYNYTNIIDFSQKAAKLLAPNLKQPNLTVPGIPIPPKSYLPSSPTPNFKYKHNLTICHEPLSNEVDIKSPENLQARHLENMQFAQNQILLHQKMALEPPNTNITNSNFSNPFNLLVNGKIIRYVPGIPGPIAADLSLDVPHTKENHIPLPSPKYSQAATSPCYSPKLAEVSEKQRQSSKSESRSPALPNKLQIDTGRILRSPKILDIQTNEFQSPKCNEMKSPNNSKSQIMKNFSVTTAETGRKFARPNTLALKPSTAAHKQHHGLTPTMFNQILISPDTPRVAKKYIQHFLHGNYFSYLGLKCSTKSVYCTLNKTQPFYVPHFKKLSMYSEWRQQETKGDKHYASCYDSQQRKLKYTTAGRASADLIVHSSYKFTVCEVSTVSEDQKTSLLLGGYESTEEYTYVRGRGRGRYICDQCGIRCKKPSMLKKHIRTHTNDRPYTCNHCNFSFKTKGNLTKHMKSKAHTKNYTASGSSNSSAHQSGTQSSDSDTDDSGLDSSDESTRQQEHEAAYGLLSLSQKSAPNIVANSQTESAFSGSFMNNEQVTQVKNTNFAKNKILDKHVTINFKTYRELKDIDASNMLSSEDMQNLTQFLGKTHVDRPLTYPYTSDFIKDHYINNASECGFTPTNERILAELPSENTSIASSSVIYDAHYNSTEEVDTKKSQHVMPLVKINDALILNDTDINSEFTRKRKFLENDEVCSIKNPRVNVDTEAIDLSMPSVKTNLVLNEITPSVVNEHANHAEIIHESAMYTKTFNHHNGIASPANKESERNLESVFPSTNIQDYEHGNMSYVIQENNILGINQYSEVSSSFSSMEYDNSAMETLADVATKQVKLEKHILAKNVASEFIKLTAKKDDSGDANFLVSAPKEVNDLLGKPEENKSCTICDKSFSKPSQLRLHMNIHYLERPFRCDPCATSFRTKGHLQKHERSAGHHNKLTSPTLSTSEPRPFKCTDCSVGFRIHGHLAKHLRSKQHIMKLEWLAKIPIGLYAELERANSLLTEINTTDGDQCLESLKTLARKVFVNESSKQNQSNLSTTINDTSDS